MSYFYSYSIIGNKSDILRVCRYLSEQAKCGECRYQYLTKNYELKESGKRAEIRFSNSRKIFFDDFSFGEGVILLAQDFPMFKIMGKDGVKGAPTYNVYNYDPETKELEIEERAS